MSEFAGLLRERIRIERQGPARSGAGLPCDDWEAVADCWAAIGHDGFGPEVQGSALSSMPRIEARVRPRDGVTVGQRLVWKGRRFLIRQRIDDPRQPGRTLLRCEEVR